MIYLDSSVALARILGETRRPPESFWARPITSSTLLNYEVQNRLFAYGLEDRLGHEAELVIAGIRLIEMTSNVLTRALRPFPAAVRTLDGLHLATMAFLRNQGEPIELASYDVRLLAAADAMGFAPLAV